MHKTSSLLALVVSTIVMMCVIGKSVYADDAASTQDTTVLDLGKIQVHGQAEIVKTLQAIKVALKAPESSDANARNNIVCRIDTDIGTHHQQFLVCATNKTRDMRRQSVHNAMLTACPNFSCSAAAAFGGGSPLNAAIDASNDHVLRMPINGAALQALLNQLPDASPRQQIPEAKTLTPDAATVSVSPAPSVVTIPP